MRYRKGRFFGLGPIAAAQAQPSTMYAGVRWIVGQSTRRFGQITEERCEHVVRPVAQRFACRRRNHVFEHTNDRDHARSVGGHRGPVRQKAGKGFERRQTRVIGRFGADGGHVPNRTRSVALANCANGLVRKHDDTRIDKEIELTSHESTSRPAPLPLMRSDGRPGSAR